MIIRAKTLRELNSKIYEFRLKGYRIIERDTEKLMAVMAERVRSGRTGYIWTVEDDEELRGICSRNPYITPDKIQAKYIPERSKDALKLRMRLLGFTYF